MADRHVIPDTRGWHVERDHTQRVSATTTAQADAVRRAVAFVTLEGGGRVVVHDADGAVLETHTVGGGGHRPRAASGHGTRRRPVTVDGTDQSRPTGGRRAQGGPLEPDDAGRRIARASEHAALPLDLLTEQVLAVTVHVARPLNPVRVAGRSAGAVMAVGLGVAALAARRDPLRMLPRSSDRRRSELRRR